MKPIKTPSCIALTLLTVSLLVCAAPPPALSDTAPAPTPMSVSVDLTSRADVKVTGAVTFTEAEGGLTIAAMVSGLTPGKHGFHIHQTGDCSAKDFSSAGGHYNPTAMNHAGPDAEARHDGDLGNLEAGADGVAKYAGFSSSLTFDELGGLAVIVHEGEDDLATQPTGNAGGRLACGVISAK